MASASSSVTYSTTAPFSLDHAAAVTQAVVSRDAIPPASASSPTISLPASLIFRPCPLFLTDAQRLSLYHSFTEMYKHRPLVTPPDFQCIRRRDDPGETIFYTHPAFPGLLIHDGLLEDGYRKQLDSCAELILSERLNCLQVTKREQIPINEKCSLLVFEEPDGGWNHVQAQMRLKQEFEATTDLQKQKQIIEIFRQLTVLTCRLGEFPVIGNVRTDPFRLTILELSSDSDVDILDELFAIAPEEALATIMATALLYGKEEGADGGAPAHLNDLPPLYPLR